MIGLMLLGPQRVRIADTSAQMLESIEKTAAVLERAGRGVQANHTEAPIHWQQEAANNVFKGTLSNASKVLEVFSNEDDAKAVSEAATAIFSGSNDVEDVARAAVWAAAAPKYRSLYGQAQQQIADLQKELAELKGAEPGLAGSPAGDGGDGAPKDAVAAFAAALRG